MEFNPDIDTRRISEFLSGGKHRRLSDHEVRAVIHWAFSEERKRQPSPELAPYRIMVMWRVCREVWKAKGLCAENETLRESTEFSPDPWIEPTKPSGTKPALARGLLALHWEDNGLPLLPPRHNEDLRVRWCDAFLQQAQRMKIDQTEEGLLGLQDLIDPGIAHMCGVTKKEVMSFESMMIEECLTALARQSEREVIKHFVDEHGLTHKEVKGLIPLARESAVEIMGASVDENRAMMELHLKELLAYEKSQMNAAGVLRTLKELAKVQGLTKTDPVDEGQQFRLVIGSTAREQDAKLEEAHKVPRLKESVQDVAFEQIDESERDALAEYDNDNPKRK